MVSRPRPGPSLAVQITSPGAEPPLERLPRHIHGLPREQVSRSQRARIVRAVAAAVAAKGYAATTVADIIGRAGVSRSTFYELYDGKEDAFLAAYAGLDIVVTQLASSSSAAPSPAEMVRAAVRAHLANLAAEPDFTWMFFVEAMSAGPRVLARRREATERFLDVLEGLVETARVLDPSVPSPDRTLLLGFVGAYRELITAHLLDAGAATLPSLEPHLVVLADRLILATPSR
jgi:AcrR family transcriptional regulator